MAHLLLLSLANINTDIHSKGSLHSHVLLMLLPVASFVHKQTHVCSLLSDQLIHESLDLMLKPLKVAATVGIMISNPVGNLCYCFTPLIAYIADTPKESLLVCIGPKALPVLTATYKQFGDAFCHPSHMAAMTLDDIIQACSMADPDNFKSFLKIAKHYHLNSVIKPFFRDWLLFEPLIFITPELLHHFHCLF